MTVFSNEGNKTTEMVLKCHEKPGSLSEKWHILQHIAHLH